MTSSTVDTARPNVPLREHIVINTVGFIGAGQMVAPMLLRLLDANRRPPRFH